MLMRKKAYAVGHAWLDAWNKADMQGYEALYAENATEVSTLAHRLQLGNARIKGKKNLLPYWSHLRSKLKNPQFTFDEIHIFKGHVLLHFQIEALKSKAIARMELNDEYKIGHIQIAHI